MKNLLDSLKKFARGSGSINVGKITSAPEIFPPTDIDHTRSSLRICERGEENGQKEIPLSDSTSQDSAELAIKDHILQIRDGYKTDYDRQMEVYKERIALYISHLDIQQIAIEFKAKLAEMKTILKIETNRVFNDESKLKALAKDIRIFRRENLLMDRFPDIPHNKDRIYLVLTSLFATELAINYFLLQGSGQVLETLTHSLLYGFINVLIPFSIFVPLIRNVNHINTLRMIVGGAMAILYALYTLIINLLMGHYRNQISEFKADAFENNVDMSIFAKYAENTMLAFENFKNSYFGIEGVIAWFLVLVGIGLSIGAIMEGWSSDDKYPGYGKKYDRYEDEFSNYVNVVEETIDIFIDERNGAIDEINTMKDALNQEFDELPNISSTASNLKGACLLAMERLENSYQMLVLEYRECNQLTRSTLVPNYFKEAVILVRPNLDDFESDAIEKPIDMIKALEAHSDELHNLFDKMIGRLQSSKEVIDDEYPFKVEDNNG